MILSSLVIASIIGCPNTLNGKIPDLITPQFRWLFDVEILMRLKMHFGKEKFQKMFIEKLLEKWIHMDDSRLGLRDSVLIPWNLFNIWRVYVYQ